MITQKVMSSLNLKYFSNLDGNQKQKATNYLRIFINNIENLPYKLSLEILKNQDLDKSLKELNFVNKKLKAQKVFRDPKTKTYFPLNFKEIIEEGKKL